jgi:hypothetical protein
MGKQFHEYTRLEKIRAGDIMRHPEHQRPSVLPRFQKKLGDFQIGKCVELIHVVANDKPGMKWLAVNGATRVEACLASKEYGPNTKLHCKVYGNGKPPSGSQLDELFLLLNSDHISVGSEIKFQRSVGAGRRSAVFAEELIARLGPRFKTRTGVWNIVEKYGEETAEAAVTFAIETWGIEQPIPGQIIKAAASVLAEPNGTAMLKKRRNALRGYTPENIRLRAQQRMLTQVGKRDDLNTWTVRVLLGQRS